MGRKPRRPAKSKSESKRGLDLAAARSRVAAARRPRAERTAAADVSTAALRSRLEHFRDGFVAIPSDPTVPAAVVLGRRAACTCGAFDCDHVAELDALIEAAKRERNADNLRRCFEDSVWHRLVAPLVEACPAPAGEVAVTGRSELAFADAAGTVLATYRSSDDDDDRRLLERLGLGPYRSSSRYRLLTLLAEQQESPEERLMSARGFPTRGQLAERSFWFRLAYHGFRELDGGAFHLSRDDVSGDVALAYQRGGATALTFALPPVAVPGVLERLAAAFPERADLALHDRPHRWLATVVAGAGDTVVARPALEVDGDVVLSHAELERARYGACAYVAPLRIFVRVRPGEAPAVTSVPRAELPYLVDALGRAHGDDAVSVDPELGAARIYRRTDGLRLTGADGRRDWTWVAVRYRFGTGSVGLRKLLAAHKARKRYVEIEGGWVDLQATGLDLACGPEPADPTAAEPAAADDEAVALQPLQLLRMHALAGASVEIDGDDAGHRARLEALLELKTASPYAQPDGFLSELRHYQVNGVDWLRYLSENRLGGLLCDDMGLGKTHQGMALLASLKAETGARPFLVVAPRTVMSHWQDKLARFAPGLRHAEYHGSDRDLQRALAGADVLITSYGVLRRDAERLAATEFAAAVFDEIQHLKNPGTQAHVAAAKLNARVRLGLTGTPIENQLEDLKALFDLVLPGYFGSDGQFLSRYVNVAATALKAQRLTELRRLTAPFVLRRLKSTVLAELPDKIEDRRTCALSDEQAELYREALRARAEALLDTLRAAERAIPFVHIFALIDLLKQICNHPALALKKLDDYRDHASGKWDLFTELLDECLESGQKVVVFSQYLGMLKLMARHLDAAGTGYVKLTGASRDRGALIRRFDEDDDCRVFLGSLKAGGTGVDLVAGSVVIHYDRWWNAAREEQATDRVHRIGQKRAVQVFKLVTSGTLEERIDGIIESKRQLMEDVVRADDPSLKKAFTREELIELLRPV